MVIVLRAGRKADLQAFFELDQICFARGVAYALDEMQYFLTAPCSATVAAEVDGSLAGFTIAELTRERSRSGGHLITIDVAPAHRRQGVGRLLLRALEERLLASRAEWLKLEVAVDNLGAFAFYTGLGFKQTGRLRGYYPGKVDALVMQKALVAV